MSDNLSERNPYPLHPGKRPYLRCTYGEGGHPSERSVSFTTTDAKPNENPLLVRGEGGISIDPKALENMFTVDKSKVIPIEGNDGLLEIFEIFSDYGTKSLIKITDKGHGGTSRMYVPNLEIDWI